MFCFYKCLTFLFEVDKKQTFAAVTTGSRRAHAYMHALEDFWEFLYIGKNPTAWTLATYLLRVCPRFFVRVGHELGAVPLRSSPLVVIFFLCIKVYVVTRLWGYPLPPSLLPRRHSLWTAPK